MINPYLFVIKHITNESANKLIYGVSFNNSTYFFSKTLHMADCKQLDSQPLLEPVVFKELCAILTEIESVASVHPSLEIINQQIGLILERLKINRP